MKSVSAGIYLAIFISFLRKVLHTACRSTKRRAPRKFRASSSMESEYVIMVEVTWDKGLDTPSAGSIATFHYLPSRVSESEAKSVADMLNNPSHRIFIEADANTLLSGTIYRCTHLHFRVMSTLMASQYIYDLPEQLGLAIKLCRDDVDNDITEMLDTFFKGLPDECDTP